MGEETIFLLIDDDEDDREFFELALTEVDPTIKFIGVPSAASGLDEILKKDLKPTFIFLDLNMPIMGGKECLVELKKNAKSENIPVIIFSTSTDPSDIKETKDLGASGFISKPSKTTELTKLLKNFIDTRLQKSIET